MYRTNLSQNLKKCFTCRGGSLEVVVVSTEVVQDAPTRAQLDRHANNQWEVTPSAGFQNTLILMTSTVVVVVVVVVVVGGGWWILRNLIRRNTKPQLTDEDLSMPMSRGRSPFKLIISNPSIVILAFDILADKAFLFCDLDTFRPRNLSQQSKAQAAIKFIS